jgi:hypothetical protein
MEHRYGEHVADKFYWVFLLVERVWGVTDEFPASVASRKLVSFLVSDQLVVSVPNAGPSTPLKCASLRMTAI